MKTSIAKQFITAVLLMAGIFIFGQSAYEKSMLANIPKTEQHLTPEAFTSLSEEFNTIGEQQKTQWQPYYYAAFAAIQKGRAAMQDNKTEALDAIADEAQKYLDKSFALSADNAENHILQKMIHFLRMLVDPMSRFMTYAPMAEESMAKAEALDPENPRISLLRGEDTYFTPAMVGGSREKGLALVKKSQAQFNSYKPKSAIDPNWGKAEAEYMVTTIMK